MNCKWVTGRVPKVDVESIQQRSSLSLPELREYDSKSGISFFRQVFYPFFGRHFQTCPLRRVTGHRGGGGATIHSLEQTFFSLQQFRL